MLSSSHRLILSSEGKLSPDPLRLTRPYGVWDTEELYDLEADPHEIVNLVSDPQRSQLVREMKEKLFGLLKDTHGMTIPIFEDRGGQSNQRSSSGTPQAPFPQRMLRK